MTTSKKYSAILIFLIFAFPVFAAESYWIIGGAKFRYPLSQSKNTLTSNLSEIIPLDILAKLSNSIERNILPDEKFERDSYKLKTERQSLYLQITSEYKKRDAYVLSDYQDYKLKSDIKESDKKIAELEKKLDANIAKFKEKEAETQKILNSFMIENVDDDDRSMSEIEILNNLVKNFFKGTGDYFSEEQVKFYKDNEGLFLPSDKISELDYTDPRYEKTVVSASINSLLTGTITSYGSYISVSVDLYTYPGATLIGSASEVGSMDDMDIITSSIARQLLPKIANSMPLEFTVTVNPPEAAKKVSLYIDDVLQKTDETTFTIASGVHRFQFISEGYQSAGTTYFFEPNLKYNIEVNLEEKKDGFIQVGLRKPLDGTMFMNGERADKIDSSRSQIAINGKALLGEFVTETGETSFFYVPKKMTADKNVVTIKPKPRDRMAYIDTRRKWMYGAYSVFMASLIPAFYTYGNYQNQVDLYKKKLIDYETAKNWQNASSVCEIISIGLGVFWGFELIRYLIAANSVLPENARKGKSDQFIYYNVEDLKHSETGDDKNENDVQ